MAINESVYGSKDTWVVYDKPSSIPKENMPQYPNFLGTTGQPFSKTSSLDAGRTAGKMAINTPIDNSIAFIGVDDNCSFAHQNWYKRGNTDGESFYVSMTQKGVNPMAWFYIPSNYIAYNNIVTFRGETDYTAWAYNQEYNTSNPDTKIGACTYMPMNMVFVIFVRALSKIPNRDNYGNVGYITLDLYTYINGHTENNTTSPYYYEAYPIIAGIMVYPFARNNTTDGEDGKANYRNVAGEYYPYPVILNDIPQFTDPDNPEKQVHLLRYAQPTLCSTNASPRSINVYSDSPSLIGSSLTISTHPILLYGGVNYDFSVPISNTKSYWYYYMGLCGQEGMLHHEFYNRPSDDQRHWAYWTTLEEFGGIANFQEFARRQAAYLGGYFAESYFGATWTSRLDSEYIFLGTIDNDGVTHGDYTQGESNRTQKQWEWDEIGKNPFNPDKKPESPDKERDSVDYRTQNLYIGLETGNYYALTATEMKQLLSWCNKIVAPEGKFTVENPTEGEYTYQELADQLRQLFNGAYPNDQIISLMYFPFDIENGLNTAIKAEGQIQLANTSTKALTGWFGSDIPEVTATKITGGTQFAVFETAPYLIEQYYGDFRDFAPYTAMSITVPYHGSIPINAGDWYGHSLKIRVNVDIITGTSIAFIYRDNAVVATISGQVGVPLQLVVRNVGDFTNTIINGNQLASQQNANLTKNLTGVLSSVVIGTVGGATGNATLIGTGVLGAVNSLTGAVATQKQYHNTKMSIEHTQASNTLVSVVSPSTSMCQDIRPMLQIVYPRLMTGYNSSVYGKTVGFACEIQGTINSFTGYSVFSGATLDGINAPDVEKNMIFQKLKEGIII